MQHKSLIEVVKGKMKDLQAFGHSLCILLRGIMERWVAWSFNGDTRMTNVVNTIAEKFVAPIGEEDNQSSGNINLRHLPGPLLDLNL